MLLLTRAWRLLGKGWHAARHKKSERAQGVVLGGHSAALCTARRLWKMLAAQAVPVYLRSTRSLEFDHGQYQADFFSTQITGASRHIGLSTHRDGLLRGINFIASCLIQCLHCHYSS